MNWTVTFRQDTERKGLGRLTARYDDGAGIECVHSDRCDTNSDFGGFIDAANAVLEKTIAERGEMLAISQKIEAVLNAGEIGRAHV